MPPEHGPETKPWQRGCFSHMRRRAACQRNRYEWDGFDLDLTYVTSRVIAMGFPGQGLEAAFRNPQTEVARFLKWAHKDKFRIYNLCGEASHSSNGFPERTVQFPVTDHCPPPLRLLLAFCRDAEEYLSRSPDNVIAVHCKAGKGRTGSMICALLVYARAVPSAYHALRWYEWARGGKRSGVTIPGQVRWVAMLERWLRMRIVDLSSDPMGTGEVHRLRALHIGPLEKPSNNKEAPRAEGGVAVRVGLSTRGHVARSEVGYWFDEVHLPSKESSTHEVALPDHGPLWYESEGLLTVHVRRKSGRLKFSVWWHHAFLRRTPAGLILDVSKGWIDGLQNDMEKDKKLPSNFRIMATFEELPPCREERHGRAWLAHLAEGRGPAPNPRAPPERARSLDRVTVTSDTTMFCSI